MSGPGFAHLVGRAMWAHCDHDGTRIDGAPGRVRLAPAVAGEKESEAATTAAEYAAWRAVYGSAATLCCPPDRCVDSRTVVAVPGRPLAMLTPDGWRSMTPPARSTAASAGDEETEPAALDFAPLPPETATAPTAPDGVAIDPAGRLWLLDRQARCVRVLADDFRVAASLALPADFDPGQLACAAFGLIVSDRSQARIALQTWGDERRGARGGGLSGHWRGHAVPAAAAGDELVALAADPRFPTAVALLRGSGRRHRLLTVTAAGAALWELPLTSEPLQLLLTAADTVLVGDVAHLPGDPRPSIFREYRLRADGVEAESAYAVRGFDGRALWLATGPDGPRVFASTAAGTRPLYPREQALRSSGSVETFALDSGIFACVWHRLFLDLCLPADCAVTVEAKTADDLPPFEIRRGARRPLDQAGDTRPPPVDDPWPPLGSLSVDDAEGWLRLGVADARPALADVPLADGVRQRPSEDPLATDRGAAPTATPAGLRSHEFLIAAPPGRYLWLRIRLQGTRRQGPALYALRASFPRPSLLDYLPAYWRADPEGAEATERALALFEGWTTELDQRVDALPKLLDPRLTPAEALSWLASFLAVGFDGRVREGVRRQLLQEAAALYRARGTLPGLTRLLSILAEAPVRIVEGFRLRRPTAAFVGDALLGPALEIGGHESNGRQEIFATGEGEDWARELEREYAALRLRRLTVDRPCPAETPAAPLPDDPLRRFYQRHAHRFTVIVPRAASADLKAVLELAIETNKPAHTLHRLCWLDAGFRVGRASLVGLSPLGPVDHAVPAVVGKAVLSTSATLHRGRRDDRAPSFATPWEISP
ncbi:MAG TPA: phage tail protein [Accumulibacter sp.]|jgi:phage tail-like protein|nr:phage tail protein [Accumulibacter sp.]